jgi:hypothetical protein
MTMDAITIALIVVLVVAVAVAAVALWGTWRRAQLRNRFGPEYERVVTSGENRQEAEAELRARLDEHDKLDLRPLTDSERDSYSQQWRRVQAEFVEQPDTALAYADRLVEQLMRDRGYPVDEFERQAGMLSVDLPDVVATYRDAHGVLERADDGELSTEDLRQALVSYRAVFDELLGQPKDEPVKESETSR